MKSDFLRDSFLMTVAIAVMVAAFCIALTIDWSEDFGTVKCKEIQGRTYYLVDEDGNRRSIDHELYNSLDIPECKECKEVDRDN